MSVERVKGEAGGSKPDGGSMMADMALEMGYPASVECVFCNGAETELHSAFGSALSVATYWCRSCRTAFEWIKWG